MLDAAEREERERREKERRSRVEQYLRSADAQQSQGISMSYAEKMDTLLTRLCYGLIALVLLSVPVCFGGCYLARNVEYSDGYRDGVIQKVSKKGAVWKTNEATMLLGGMSFKEDGEGGGTLTRQMFLFTCANDEVAEQVEKIPPNKVVRVHYKQKLSTWRPNGDTSYFVERVEILGDEKK